MVNGHQHHSNGYSYSDTNTPTHAHPTPRPFSASALLSHSRRSPISNSANVSRSVSRSASTAKKHAATGTDGVWSSLTNDNHQRPSLDNADADDDAFASDASDHDDHEDEAIVVHEVQQAAAPQLVSRARLVTVAKRVPPKLPPRNPIRGRGKPLVIGVQTDGAGSPGSEGGARSAGSGERSPGGWGVDGVREEEEGEREDGDVEDEMARRMGAMLGDAGSKERLEEFHSLPATPEVRTPSPTTEGAERVVFR